MSGDSLEPRRRSTSTSKRERTIGMGWEGRGCPVLIRGTTQEYRQALLSVVRSDDICVEIGSAAGVTTQILARRSLRTIGVDASHHEIEGARDAAVRNGWDMTYGVTSRLQFVVAQISCKSDDECEASLSPLLDCLAQVHEHQLSDVTLLAIDIAGTAPLEIISPLIVKLRRLMKPRVTVVKNLALKKLLVAVEAGEELLPEDC
jgi:hypothetical protein